MSRVSTALRDGGEIVSVRLCRFAMVPKVKSVGFGARRLDMLVRTTSLPYITKGELVCSSCMVETGWSETQLEDLSVGNSICVR